MSINDNTPVLVGCGQVTQKVDEAIRIRTSETGSEAI